MQGSLHPPSPRRGKSPTIDIINKTCIHLALSIARLGALSLAPRNARCLPRHFRVDQAKEVRLVTACRRTKKRKMQ